MLLDAGVSVAVVRLCTLLAIPEADRDRAFAVGGNECQLILESVLLPKHRKHVMFQGPGELGTGIVFQVDGKISCVHESSCWDCVGWNSHRHCSNTAARGW